MNKRKLSNTFLCSLLFLIGCSQSISEDPVQLAVENTDRTKKFTERDKFRNPAATLNFFGIKPEPIMPAVARLIDVKNLRLSFFIYKNSR